MQVIARIRECTTCGEKQRVDNKPWLDTWVCKCGQENRIDHAAHVKIDDVFIMG